MQIWKERNITFHIGLKKCNFMLLKNIWSSDFLDSFFLLKYLIRWLWGGGENSAFFHFFLPFVFLFYIQCFKYGLYLIQTVFNMHSLSMTLLEKVTEKKPVEQT